MKFRIFFAEPFDTARSVHQFLFPGEKRVTVGTDFNAYIGLGGADFYHVSAHTGYGGLNILGMNIRFHYFSLLKYYRADKIRRITTGYLFRLYSGVTQLHDFNRRFTLINAD
jgi:hypothetical protein